METAMAQDGRDFEVTWKPFRLRPDNPAEGTPKAPNTPDNPRVGAHMKQAGESVGIDFTGLCDRSPNTLLAHCLLDHAFEAGGAARQGTVAEVLFRSYFTDGTFPDEEALVACAAEAGLDAEGARAALRDGKRQERVAREASNASRKGIRGVPYFFVNGQPAFSGAQSPAAFAQAFDQLAPK